MLILGAALVIRFAHWVGAVRRRGIDARIKEAIEAGNVVAEAEKLSRLVAQFQTGQVEVMPPVTRTIAPAKKPRIPVHAPTGKFVAVSRSSEPSGSATEDWDEF